MLAPTASLTANPNTITAGQTTTLTWKTEHATDVAIDQMGKVDASGSLMVTPAQSTTYHLVAKNEGGTQEATARVTVISPPSTPSQQTSNETEAQMFAQNVQDVFFAYDSYDIEPQYQKVLRPTRGSCSSIPISTSPWRAIAMSAVQPSTTSRWATIVPTQPSRPWCNWA